jgi:hypothetical protein
MSELGTSPRPPKLNRRMSAHGEMTVSIHNEAVRGFNTFYKQPLPLGTIPETPENTNMTITEVMRSPRT